MEEAAGREGTYGGGSSGGMLLGEAEGRVVLG